MSLELVSTQAEIQNKETQDRQQETGIGLSYLFVTLISLGIFYSVCCFALGFRTKGIVSKLRSIPEKLSPKKAPRLREGSYQDHHGSRCY